MRTWRIRPLDTLFFRGGQPFNAGESAYIESLFPPSPETSQGLVRTSILYRHARDMAGYMAGTDGSTAIAEVDLFSEIGNPKHGGVGRLRVQGPFPIKGGNLLFPAPLDLARTPSGLAFLRPGDRRMCDLGSVRLTAGPGEALKILERVWLTGAGMERVLRGDLPGAEDLVPEQVPEGFLRKTVQAARHREGATLYVMEPRLGIARSNSTRTAKEGHLYAIAPVRLRDDVEFVLGVDGIDERLHPARAQVLRFGGEGKLVQITADGAWSLPQCPPGIPSTRDRTRFRIILVTPGRFGGWHLPGFQPIERDGESCWSGNVNGLSCEIASACVGKSSRVGGWDFVKGDSKPLESCVPGGSVYFCETPEPWGEVTRLHGQTIGRGKEIGFGLMLIGRWT